jgi:undecaprenyl-diphosphatase
VRRPASLSLTSLREIGSIAVRGIIALGLLGFAQLADEVLEQETHAFDIAALTFLRLPQDTSTPIGPDWLFNAMTGASTSLSSPPSAPAPCSTIS